MHYGKKVAKQCVFKKISSKKTIAQYAKILVTLVQAKAAK
jgi:phage-related holin